MDSEQDENNKKKARFINVKTDVGFKHVFGQERFKDVLIAFLNRLFEGEMIITDVIYHDKELLPLYHENKTLIYDVYCTTPLEEHFIVEMQCEPQDFFQARALTYASRAIVQQAEKGHSWNYSDLKAVYLISILNFKMENLPGLLKSSASIRNDQGEHETINPLLRFINIQLPFVPKTLKECTNNLERWVYMIKNLEKMESIPEDVKEMMSELGRFEEAASIASLSKEEYAVYQRSLKNYRDRMAALSYHEKRENQRYEEGKVEMIRNFAANGVPMDVIVSSSGYDIEHVREILGEGM